MVKQGSVKAFEVYRVNPKDSGRQSEYEDNGVINVIKRSAKDEGASLAGCAVLSNLLSSSMSLVKNECKS